MGAEEPALGKMRKTTGVGAAKVEGGLLSGGFMMNVGPWDDKREDGHCLAQSIEDAGARKKHQTQSTRMNVPDNPPLTISPMLRHSWRVATTMELGQLAKAKKTR
jgi:hypothetical protein